MKKRIVHVAAALALFWLCWQLIDKISNAMFGLGAVEVLVSLALIVIAGIFSWCFGDFLTEKFLDW